MKMSLNAADPNPAKELSQRSFVIFWICAAVLVLSGILLPETLSLLRADYTSSRNYISELGARGAAYAQVVNLFGFLPVALSSAGAIWCLRARLPKFAVAKLGLLLLIGGLSMGYLAAFLFPCDDGCPVEGTTRQLIHNLLGLVQYPIGTLGLVLLAIGLDNDAFKKTRVAVCVVALFSAVGFVMMLHPEQADLRGFWQRFADYGMFILIVYLGAVLPQTRA